ncbi:glycosyl transferase [Gossypium australe]|uniref:Glycosyl transferase n=1 Tax=Gossypium australe TaxID=47621 RepID=A0A5B6WLU3_9ROSI|nr:glycosyl transferase [Gossypium australe]
MAFADSKIIVFLCLVLIFASSLGFCKPTLDKDPTPTPTPWPLQFHSILVMNYSGILQVIDLWYDWPNGRNFNIIQHQLGNVLYDLEWNNGTSFFYTLDSSKTCSSAHVEVGILRPNWLEGATYLGQQHVDGFLCNVWEKVEFIWYFEDVVTKKPVHWVFYTGREAHVMTFEVGAVLEDSKWQAPVYCFHNTTASIDSTTHRLLDGVLKGSTDL